MTESWERIVTHRISNVDVKRMTEWWRDAPQNSKANDILVNAGPPKRLGMMISPSAEGHSAICTAAYAAEPPMGAADKLQLLWALAGQSEPVLVKDGVTALLLASPTWGSGEEPNDLGDAVKIIW